MKKAVLAQWWSERSGVSVASAAGPQFAASSASSSQALRFFQSSLDCRALSPTGSASKGGCLQRVARLRSTLPRSSGGRFSAVVQRRLSMGGLQLARWWHQGAVAGYNKCLVPTRETYAPSLRISSRAAQAQRYAGKSEMKQSMSAQWLSERSAVSSRAVAGPAVRRVCGRINEVVIARRLGSLVFHRFCSPRGGSREAEARLRSALRQRVAVGSASSSCSSLWSASWSVASAGGCGRA